MQDDSQEPTPPAGDSIIPLLRARLRALLVNVYQDPYRGAVLMRSYDHPTPAVDVGGRLLNLNGKLLQRRGPHHQTFASSVKISPTVKVLTLS